MPNLFLDPIAENDAQGKPTGDVTDPAADIVAFLLSVPTDWQAGGRAGPRRVDATKTRLTCSTSRCCGSRATRFPRAAPTSICEEGIPEVAGREAEGRRAAAGELAIDPQRRTRTQRQLEYVARRTISKYGCFGCHDIPGLRRRQADRHAAGDWGRKDPSKLAFENIHKFLETHGIDADGADRRGNRAAPGRPRRRRSRATGAGRRRAPKPSAHEGALHAEHLDPGDKFSADDGLLPAVAQQPRPRRLPVAEAADPAQLRLQDDAQQELQRTAAHAEVPVQRRSSAKR